jgi:hypothetical protein
MPSYIELDKQSTFPSSSDVGKLIFGVNTSNEATLTDSNGTTYNFGTGSTNNLNYQTYDIDLQLGTYSISDVGVYRISRGDNSNTNTINLPDPGSLVGGTIILINNDTSSNETANFGGSYLPYSLGSNSNSSSISFDNIFILYSINNEWRGGKLAGL